MNRTASLLALASVVAVIVLVACTSKLPDPLGPDDAGADASPEPDSADANKLTGRCASTFGTALTNGFGRVDGILYAVQKPSDTACVMPNSDHVVVQVLVDSAVYRLVANVMSTGTNPNILGATVAHALPTPAFAEGWHVGAALDYATTLGVHSDATFTSLDRNAAVAKIAGALTVGDPIAVYATVGDGVNNSAHLIHRNLTNQDGAIVVNPMAAMPSFLLFHFDDQTF